MSPDLKDEFVYQTEYTSAAKIAENDDIPIRLAPNAPLVPSKVA